MLTVVESIVVVVPSTERFPEIVTLFENVLLPAIDSLPETLTYRESNEVV